MRRHGSAKVAAHERHVLEDRLREIGSAEVDVIESEVEEREPPLPWSEHTHRLVQISSRSLSAGSVPIRAKQGGMIPPKPL